MALRLQDGFYRFLVGDAERFSGVKSNIHNTTLVAQTCSSFLKSVELPRGLKGISFALWNRYISSTGWRQILPTPEILREPQDVGENTGGGHVSACTGAAQGGGVFFQRP